MNIENKAVNTLRMLSVDQIENANSGHPGLPLGAAPMAYALFKNHLVRDSKDLNWKNRDRFVLSAGHGSALLYSLFYLFDYGLSLDDLKNFRQLDSKTPGHPEYGHTRGVEATTGPLGQGIAMAVGMAIAEEKLAALYNKDDLKLVDHYTYALVGDGCLMEGISNEASSLAGTLKLDKLIVLYDSNKISIEGSTDLAFSENVCDRYKALGWDTFVVHDGNDLDEINAKIEEAKKSDKPALIEVKTKIGYGSPREDSAKAHGEPLGKEDRKSTREFFGLPDEDFYVDEDVKAHFQKIVEENTARVNEKKKIEEEYAKKYPKEYEDYLAAFNLEKKELLEDSYYDSFDKDMATRAISGEVLNKIAKDSIHIFGGSADLGPSNKTMLKGEEYFSADNRLGRNITFGVRENAMGAITNGILLHGGLRTYASTFLVFSDYLKPTIRLAALMNLPNVYIFTHDSIGVGEDGPTHQPIEHLAMLRSIPGIVVIRPADGRETAASLNLAFNSKNTPFVLALSRQNLPQLENSSRDVYRGAYIIKKEEGELEKIVIATGSEVSLALEAAEGLKGVRVVSMPSMEMFDAQSSDYKEEILPSNITKRISLEALSSFGWHKYIGIKGMAISIDTFGASGKGSEVFERFGFTKENIRRKIQEF
ncbi:MAG: transketolase [Peptoniphilus harei]|uniref:transketolase n=1 Tax=Peptoniphilus harei TaxID=54005 RepID=UPI0025514B8B|nr:transketolase [Peptoniphilus harei]MDK7754802.1 transketolase [Peptoniphilus harei]MDK7760608.1 transketolase [Peptoniphilus harei]MDK8270399.1 transketolase [Peptoniphilus harei]MDK8338858.1 transketolase [Peptoniphilus harei]